MREKEREKLEFDDLMTRAGNKILQRDRKMERERENVSTKKERKRETETDRDI